MDFSFDVVWRMAVTGLSWPTNRGDNRSIQMIHPYTLLVIESPHRDFVRVKKINTTQQALEITL